MANITLREWIENYKSGKYSSVEAQIEAGWFDWFCSTGSLVNRLKKFGALAKKIDNDYILDNYRVWFKNNCPIEGPTYDDMRFEPLDESKRGELYFGICIDDKRYDYKYEVFTARSGCKDELATNDKAEVVEWINNFGKDIALPF